MGTVSNKQYKESQTFIKNFILLIEKGENQFRKTLGPFEKQKGSFEQTATTKVGSTKSSQGKRS